MCGHDGVGDDDDDDDDAAAAGDGDDASAGDGADKDKEQQEEEEPIDDSDPMKAIQGLSGGCRVALEYHRFIQSLKAFDRMSSRHSINLLSTAAFRCWTQYSNGKCLKVTKDYGPKQDDNFRRTVSYEVRHHVESDGSNHHGRC